jgi:hypothetical protein
VTEQCEESAPDLGVRMLLEAVAAPVADAQVLPGERAALEAFREQHGVGRRRVRSVRIRRSAGAVAAGVGLVLTSGTAAAAATGVLPDPAQHLAHAWFERVGISVPDAGGFIERDNSTRHRGATLPDRAPVSVAPSSAGELDPLRPADDVPGTPGPRSEAPDPGTPAEHDHRSPPAASSPPSPEVAGDAGMHPATPVAPTSPGAPPATPPADPEATPPATPDDQPRGNPGDRRRDPPKPSTPAPANASSAVSPPASQLDRDPPVEETRKRRPR